MTDKYAVIGNPIAHSKSPQIHRMFAEQTGQDISYEAILAPLDGFAATVERLCKEGYKGCNVTVPFKFEAFNIATELSERARSAQAVNTLSFDGDAIRGDNTDGTGLVHDIERNLHISLQDKRVLLMGAGGAAHGVVQPLFGAGSNLSVVNRTIEKAWQMIEPFDIARAISIYEYSMLNYETFDILINATSSGLIDEMPPLPQNSQIPLMEPLAIRLGCQNTTSKSLVINPPFAKGEAKVPPFAKGGPGGIFAPGALAYDMMYGRETPFMKFARANGAAIVSDGLGMLVEQAAEAFFIWRGVRPDTAPVIAALRRPDCGEE